MRKHLAKILATFALVLLLAGIFWLVNGLAMAGPGNDEREVAALEAMKALTEVDPAQPAQPG